LRRVDLDGLTEWHYSNYIACRKNEQGTNAMSSAVGIREARLNFSRLVKLVQGGAQIVITDRGRAVGKLVPIDPGESRLDERVSRLRRQGLLAPKPALARIPVPLQHGGDAAQRLLREDRDRGR
jgi:prevent-host-death family protein